MTERRYFVKKDALALDLQYSAWVTYDGKDLDNSTAYVLLGVFSFRWTAKRACAKHNRRKVWEATSPKTVEEVFVDV